MTHSLKRIACPGRFLALCILGLGARAGRGSLGRLRLRPVRGDRAAPRPAAPRARESARQPSASSTSARPATSATTRPRTPAQAPRRQACPNLKILEEDEIPETSNMATAAEQEIAQGAKIIFSTSYGYKDYALTLAAKHPDVAFLQQGNYMTPPVPANANTYFGNVYETVYLGGHRRRPRRRRATSSASWPRSRSRRRCSTSTPSSSAPRASTRRSRPTLVFTGAWCDPGKQADAAKSPARGGRRRAHAAPGLHRDGHQGSRGRQGVLGRLPLRRRSRSRRRAG